MRSFFVLSILSVSASAQAGFEWIWNRKITQIYPHSGGLTFYLDGTTVGAQSCGSNGNRFLVPITAPNYDAIVSTLFTSFAADYQTSANYDDTTLATCDIRVNRVIVVK